MRFTIFTLFPEWFQSPLETALLGRAVKTGLVQFRLVNPRNWAEDRHKTVDDRPYGGGPGMVMMPEPLLRALQDTDAQLKADNAASGLGRILLLSASGEPFSQKMATELSRESAITLVCGRYEGIDARISQLLPLQEVAVGESVLNGGEAAAMQIIESVSRLLPGFMGKEESGAEESFSAGLLEYPHFTRPENFAALPVPDVLLSGNHAHIAQWRREQSLLRTWQRRPNLLNEAALNAADMAFLRNYAAENGRQRLGRSLVCALVHHPVLLGRGKSGTSSLTNLDIHDIARCCRTYGLRHFLVITPLADQQNLLQILVRHWTEGAGGQTNPDRAAALHLVKSASSIDEGIQQTENEFGQHPLVLATSARDYKKAPRITPEQVRTFLQERPLLLLFGTAHGLAPEVLDNCDGILRPLRWLDNFNHLSVRSALAITLDRLLGDLD